MREGPGGADGWGDGGSDGEALAAERGGDLANEFLFAAVEGGEVRGVEEKRFGGGAFFQAGGRGVPGAVSGEKLESAAVGCGVVGFGVRGKKRSKSRSMSKSRIGGMR
jgi:hypothetical protein